MKRFDYLMPTELKEAFRLMEERKGNAMYVAGGTDLIVKIKQRVVETDALISLRNIQELKGVRENGGLALGSLTLFREIERNEAISKQYPALFEAAKALANPQIRNVATIGGNICNAAPSTDSVPPLLVLEARFKVQGPGGTKEIAADEFFKGPGETILDPVDVLTEIIIPECAPNTYMAFQKIGRVTQDIAKVNAAALLVMEGDVCKRCLLAAGAVAPVPLRLKNTEKLVEGRKITEELLEEVKKSASGEVSPITDVRSTEEYRRMITGVLVKRAIKQALGI